MYYMYMYVVNTINGAEFQEMEILTLCEMSMPVVSEYSWQSSSCKTCSLSYLHKSCHHVAYLH